MRSVEGQYAKKKIELNSTDAASRAAAVAEHKSAISKNFIMEMWSERFALIQTSLTHLFLFDLVM